MLEMPDNSIPKNKAMRFENGIEHNVQWNYFSRWRDMVSDLPANVAFRMQYPHTF
jgi:hypothetical protein